MFRALKVVELSSKVTLNRVKEMLVVGFREL